MSDVKRFLVDCEHGIANHKKTIEVLEGLLSLAKAAESDSGMGAVFVDKDRPDWDKTEKQIKDIANCLQRIAYEWMLSARLEFMETQGEKQ